MFMFGWNNKLEFKITYKNSLFNFLLFILGKVGLDSLIRKYMEKMNVKIFKSILSLFI